MKLSVALVLLALPLMGAAGAPAPPAAAPADPIDGVPKGMVAFFTGGACPDGWQLAGIATGRILVGTVDAETVGRTVGTPLGPEEDRAHGHPVHATVALPPKNVAAADGPNNGGAASGNQPLVGEAAPATTQLPFLQLTACMR